MSQATIEKKVQDYLRNSELLEQEWQKPITHERLQAEMDRMAQHTKQPEVLRELFAALSNDPFVIAECLARPVLAERIANGDPVAAGVRRRDGPEAGVPTPTPNPHPGRADYTAVWTGSEMIIWGGRDENFVYSNTGGRYNPSTNSWTATTTTNAPTARGFHTAV